MILNPPTGPMAREQALNLAVWLTAVAGFGIADFECEFIKEIG